MHDALGHSSPFGPKRWSGKWFLCIQSWNGWGVETTVSGPHEPWVSVSSSITFNPKHECTRCWSWKAGQMVVVGVSKVKKQTCIVVKRTRSLWTVAQLVSSSSSTSAPCIYGQLPYWTVYAGVPRATLRMRKADRGGGRGRNRCLVWKQLYHLLYVGDPSGLPPVLDLLCPLHAPHLISSLKACFGFFLNFWIIIIHALTCFIAPRFTLSEFHIKTFKPISISEQCSKAATRKTTLIFRYWTVIYAKL